MDFKGYTKKNLSILRDVSPMLKILVEDLENVNKRIDEIDIHIAEKWEMNQYARIIQHLVIRWNTGKLLLLKIGYFLTVATAQINTY